MEIKKEHEEFLMIAEAGKYIVKIANKARKHGLLEIENYIERYKFKDEEINDFIAEVCTNIINGVDPDIVGKNATDVIMANFTEETVVDRARYGDAKTYFILLDALLSIQKGENPHIIKQSIKSKVKNKYKKEFDEIMNRNDGNDPSESDEYSKTREEHLMKMLKENIHRKSHHDDIAQRLSDPEWQAIVRYIASAKETEQNEFYNALTLFDGEIILKIIENASKENKTEILKQLDIALMNQKHKKALVINPTKKDMKNLVYIM